MKKHALIAVLMTGAFAAAPSVSQAADCKKQKQGKKCAPSVKQGRMTGHGHQFNYQGFAKVQWEFRNSVCNANRFPDLKVEFGGNKFVMTSYNSPGLICFTQFGTGAEGNPVAGFDSIRASGSGTLNGVPGANVTFIFGDRGEPGRNDTADILITVGTNVALDYEGVAGDGGNHQAHRR